jgi:hypothetical protein
MSAIAWGNWERVLRQGRSAVACALLAAGTITGCSSTNSRPAVVATSTPVVDNTVVQTGKIIIQPRTPQDVYFPTPFAGTPKLDVPDHWGTCTVVKADSTHFRVLNYSDSPKEVTWKASGVKGVAMPVLGTPIQQASATVPTPPATPPSPQPYAATQPPAYATAPPAAAPTVSPPPALGGGLPSEPVPVAAPR